MQKSAPTLPRLLTMVVFALTCFGLLLFLWLSFGGPVPLKPQGYRVQGRVPRGDAARPRGRRARRRRVGRQGRQEGRRPRAPEPHGRDAAAQNKFAPLSQDARAILRQKTLLGETYVELTPGNPKGPKIPENGWLADSHVQNTVQLDEILQALDPVTRKAFQNWQQSLAQGIGTGANSRGRDLNDAFGNLPGFAAGRRQRAGGARRAERRRRSGWSRTPASCSAR